MICISLDNMLNLSITVAHAGFIKTIGIMLILSGVGVLHVLWHQLVKKEELIMTDTFGDAYKDYARRTGRFFPRML